MTGGIIEIDVHGKNTEEAKKAINMQIHSAGKSIYRIRVIHGYNGGTGIKAADKGCRHGSRHGADTGAGMNMEIARRGPVW